MEIHVVREGDTAFAIAAAYGVSVEQIVYDNQLIYPYELAVGQALLIRVGDRNPAGLISVGGYAYPFISNWVLNETLPFLTDLFIFSYGFTAQGHLLPPLWDDVWMIQAAERYGTKAILTLTPLGEDGRFSNILIHELVSNQQAVDTLIQEMLYVMGVKGYQGVDIDFEYILVEDRDLFTAFVDNVAEAMRTNGYQTSVALAPKTSADQVGVLYEGKDYRALGEIADFVLLMTYEWGYTYGH